MLPSLTTDAGGTSSVVSVDIWVLSKEWYVVSCEFADKKSCPSGIIGVYVEIYRPESIFAHGLFDVQRLDHAEMAVVTRETGNEQSYLY